MNNAGAYLQGLNEAAEVQIDSTKSLKLYLRSTELVFKQACIYLNEGDLERSFILFLKFSNLVLQKLPMHPEYANSEHSQSKTNLRSFCIRALDQLEALRPRLISDFEAAVEAAAEATQRTQVAEAERSRIEQEIAQLRAQKQLSSAGASTAISSTVNYQLKQLSEQYSHLPTEPMPMPVPVPVASKYFSESGQGLRPVHVPRCIIDRFLELASENTRRNLETCGVLAGKLHHNEFTITCMIIPKQTATSDTCAMTNEEEIVDAQDRLDVLSLGWIHTHPTQSCFLSSVDLHTHMPFQLLMDEAIAIVCAPTRNPNFGIFRLTDPPGLNLISKCPHSAGSFHPHPEDSRIYRELSGPDGHAQLNSNLPLEVIDLRPRPQH